MMDVIHHLLLLPAGRHGIIHKKSGLLCCKGDHFFFADDVFGHSLSFICLYSATGFANANSICA